MALSDEILDELLKDFKSLADFDGSGGAFAELKKRIMERSMQAELRAHLGFDKHERTAETKQNYRNGSRQKTVISQDDKLDIEVPRDRNGT